MAAKMGGRLLAGDSKLFKNSVGVVQLAYDGYDLGKTNADTTISIDQDIMDVTYQQTGTKPADHIRTGMEWTVSATFSEISTSLIALLQGGVSSQNRSAVSDSMRLDPELYQSLIATKSGPLKIIAVDGDLGLSTREIDHWNFYRAIPIIDGDIVNWGADSQRSMPVMFRIKGYEFPKPNSYASSWGFGYVGDPSLEKFPAIDWPDVLAPGLVAAVATSTTEMTLEFTEDIVFAQGATLPLNTIIADVDGLIKIPTTAGTTISTDTLTLKFAANSFASGSDIRVTVTNRAVKDKATPTANAFPGVSGFQVRNEV